MVSPKWIAQVFRDRGIPVPSVDNMGGVIAHLDEEELDRLYQAVLLVERAVETKETIPWLQAIFKNKPVSSLREASPLVAPPKKDQPAELAPKVPPQLLAEQRDKRSPKQESAVEVPRKNHHIYGKKAAITIELDTLRKQAGSTETVWTVVFEAADSVGRTTDWDEKIQFQLMRRELPLVASWLLGMVDKPVLLEYHGPDRDKSLYLEDQGSKLYVKVSQGTRVVSLPVDHADMHALGQIVLEALQLNAPGTGEYMQVQLLRRVAAMANKK